MSRRPEADQRAADSDPESAARAICLRQLAHAPRTRAQLADAMARRGIPGDVADAVLDRFDEVGLIDDALFAAAWVRSRHTGRGLARRALAHELRGRGVADEIVQDAVEQLGDEEELQTARDLVARRLAATKGLPVETRVRRLAGVLTRKGYSPGLALRVVREALVDERQHLTGDPQDRGEPCDAGSSTP